MPTMPFCFKGGKKLSATEEKKLIEDYEIRPVPKEERKSWYYLTMVWIAGIIALSATALGGALGSGMSLKEAIIASAVGCFLLSIFNSLCAIVGNKTGISTGMISTFALGRFGSILVSIVIAISLFGWFGVQLDLFGSSLFNVINNVFGVEINKVVLMIFGGALMTITSMIGYKGLEKLSLFATPLLGILLIGSAYIVLKNYGYDELSSAPLTMDPLTVGGGISLVIGSLAIGAIIAPDFSRYSKSTKDTVIASTLSYFIGYAIVLILAVLLAKATSEVDVVAIMIGIGWGTGAMLVLILAQWTTNNTNLYSSSLAFSVVFKKVPKYIITILAGIIGTTLAVFGIYDNFISFLSILSIMIPPVGGIYVADYMIRSHSYDFKRIDSVRKFNVWSLVIWVLAITVAFLTTAPPTGLGILSITSVPAVDAFVISFVLQFIVSKFNLDKREERV